MLIKRRALGMVTFPGREALHMIGNMTDLRAREYRAEGRHLRAARVIMRRPDAVFDRGIDILQAAAP